MFKHIWTAIDRCVLGEEKYNLFTSKRYSNTPLEDHHLVYLLS